MLKKLPNVDEKHDNYLDIYRYYSQRNAEACEAHSITPLIATKREKHNQSIEERFSEPYWEDQPQNTVERMKRALKTKEGKQLYALRKSTSETVFGIIKQAMGFRQFSSRGFQRVAHEWNLVCMAWNIKRLHRIIASTSG
jgi:hypothetical protein